MPLVSAPLLKYVGLSLCLTIKLYDCKQVATASSGRIFITFSENQSVVSKVENDDT